MPLAQLNRPIALTDDRGLSHDVHPRRWLRSTAARQKTYRPLVRTVCERLYGPSFKGRWQVSATATFGLVFGFAIVATLILRVDLTAQGMILAGVAFLASRAIERAYLRRALPTQREAIVSSVIGEGLCAVCWSDLAVAQPADDGMLVCSKCGAAWKLEIGSAQGPAGTPGGPCSNLTLS